MVALQFFCSRIVTAIDRGDDAAVSLERQCDATARAAGAPGYQCASCHDYRFENSGWAEHIAV